MEIRSDFSSLFPLLKGCFFGCTKELFFEKNNSDFQISRRIPLGF